MNAANLKFRIQTLLVLILTLSRCLWADESNISTFIYNGALINNSGQVLAVQGTRQFTVSLYENPFGGSAGYIQTLNNIDVDQGYFSLEIGPALPDLSNFNYLELQIDGEVMNPRIELKSFAFSMVSKNTFRFNDMNLQEFKDYLSAEYLGHSSNTAQLGVRTLIQGETGLHPLLVNPLNDTSDPALLVRNDGTVGIGTSNPTETLEVVGGIKAVDGKFTNLEVSGDGTFGSTLKVDQAAGRVGIGTVNPEIDLQIVNTVTGAGISVGTLVATTSSEIELKNPNQNFRFILNRNGLHGLSLTQSQSNTSVMYFTRDNRIGVNGVESPEEVLHVNGNVKADVFIGEFRATKGVAFDLDMRSGSLNGTPIGTNNASTAVFQEVTADRVELISTADTPFKVSQSANPNSELLRLTSGGDLGVGTNNPLSKVHVSESDPLSPDRLVTLEGNAPAIFLKEIDANSNQNMQVRLNNGDLEFQTASDGGTALTTVFRVSQDGAVGVGIDASLSDQLEIAKTQNGLTSLRITSQADTANTGTAVRFFQMTLSVMILR